MNSKFKRLHNDSKVKFTIILGSGFHLQAKQKDSILSSWEMLLQKLSPDCKLSKIFNNQLPEKTQLMKYQNTIQ